MRSYRKWPQRKIATEPQAWALGGADLQHGFDGSAGQHVRHGIVDRRVRIVSYQPLNRQLASAVEVNQARQKGFPEELEKFFTLGRFAQFSHDGRP